MFSPVKHFELSIHIAGKGPIFMPEGQTPQATFAQHSYVVGQLCSPHFQVKRISRDMLHAIIGCATESGEMMDVVKKAIFYDIPPDIPNLDEEFGDLLWYVTLYCRSRSITIHDLWAQNIAKLRTRYGDKFSAEKANPENRNLNQERDVLESTYSEIAETTLRRSTEETPTDHEKRAQKDS